jgi:NADPH-dependent 2,4-dienoyl-CoA reductase/sulfur reductase-like enzyme
VDVGGGMRFDDPASAPASSTTSSPSVKRLSSSAGGIGGLAAALALTRKGLRVAVLEQASRFGEVGGGMQIAPNCTRILAEWGCSTKFASLAFLRRASS